MNALVVYFSKFGNTQLVAEAIAETLSSEGAVRVISSEALTAADINGVDLVVMGSPTHRMNLPQAVRPVFETLPKRVLTGIPVAVFDTSYKMSWWLNHFTAAKRLSQELRKLGGKRIVPPETFHVTGREGPLYEGEIERPFVEPHSVKGGLAVYSVGSGKPVLLFPYPHAQTTTPMAQGPIAEILAGLGRRVVTFDVPGAYRSLRDPVGDVEEMIRCAEETLDILGIEGPVDVVGHSMGGLNALAFAIDRPERTKRLVLIGSMSGFPAVLKWGMPRSSWHFLEADNWKFMFWGIQVKSGRGSLATHKKLQNLMTSASCYDETLFTPVEIDADDHEKGVPIREIIWGKNMYRGVSYSSRLGLVKAPTIILVGRHDLEAPVACSEELYQGIPKAELVIFEKSGHYPYIEEPNYFTSTLVNFLQ